jgi:Ca2+-binding EF-hand superfamily protein
MKDFKKVLMTSSEALEIISMFEDRIKSNNEEINEAHFLSNMKDQERENEKLKWMIDRLDKVFWDKKGNLI